MENIYLQKITIVVRIASQDRVRNASQERESGTRQKRESGTRQECESGTCQERESGTRPGISPRLRAATRLRIAALGGFGPSQARPQQAPFVGAALMVMLASVAAWAALDSQLTPDGAALVALVRGSHQQALGWAALVTPVPQGYWSGWQDSSQVSS